MVNEILRAFPDARVHSGYVRIRCPYHKDGKEARPSMGIILEQRENTPAGFCHCFACGKTVMLNELLAYIGVDSGVDTRNLKPAKAARLQLLTTTPLLKTQLPFRKSAYLEARGIGEEVQAKFKIYEKDGKVYMPVFSRDGILLYTNARSTKTKMFFVERGAVKTLWGIEEIDYSKPIVVCESQIDAMSCWEIGMQAVATLSADNVKSLEVLKFATSSCIILAFDPDKAGIEATNAAVKLLGKFRCKWIDLPVGVDVNQALQDIKDKQKFKDFMLRCVKDFVH